MKKIRAWAATILGLASAACAADARADGIMATKAPPAVVAASTAPATCTNLSDFILITTRRPQQMLFR